MRGFNEGKSIQFWRNVWNARPHNESNYDKAIALLHKYTGGVAAPIGGGVWFIGFGSFFKGQWHSHHKRAAALTVDWHTTWSSTAYNVHPEACTVTNLLGDLKLHINNAPMNASGDLHRILEVINENTNVSYDQIDINRDGLIPLQETGKVATAEAMETIKHLLGQ
jgi:hypothetical protein